MEMLLNPISGEFDMAVYVTTSLLIFFCWDLWVVHCLLLDLGISLADVSRIAMGMNIGSWLGMISWMWELKFV